jgi:nitrite reductase (NADH) large subunit
MRRLSFNQSHCLACKSCEIACVLAHSQAANLEMAVGETPVAKRRVRVGHDAEGVAALRCAQCDEPLCVFACKSGALSRDPQTLRTTLDQAQCVGCGMCLMVCPFGIRMDSDRNQAVRCDVCAERDVPACVAACPTRALGVQDETSPRVTSTFAGRLVVVGSSAAGIAACEAGRECAPGCSITLVTADELPQYSRPLLTYALSGHLTRQQLDWRADEYLQGALGVELLRDARAASLRPEARKLCLADGRELGYDALVVATGARGQRLQVPGANLPGVFTLRNLEDLDAIESLLGTARRAVVVGGGNVGLQTCEALLTRGLDVTVVYRSAHLLSQMVDQETSQRVGALFTEHKLTLRPGRDPVKFLGTGCVTGVELDNGEVLDAQIVVIGKGIRPNVEWLSGSGVEVRRGVVVDRCGRTNLPDVYAAGDCAETIDPLTGGSAVSGVWPVAYEMGRVAGSTAVGVERQAVGALRMNASKYFGKTIISIGEVREERLPDARAEVLEANSDVYRKLVYRDERLVGALLYGDISRAGEFYRLYREAAERPLEKGVI